MGAGKPVPPSPPPVPVVSPPPHAVAARLAATAIPIDARSKVKGILRFYHKAQDFVCKPGRGLFVRVVMTSFLRSFTVAFALALSCGGLGCAGSIPTIQTPIEAPPGDAGMSAVPAPDAALTELAKKAADADLAIANPAIAELRERGPAGLDALFYVHAAAIAKLPGGRVAHAGAVDSGADPARVRRAIEIVAKQKDVHASRLYWYTDLDRAKDAARASGKPILALRLLGGLDADLSCANSRFFRTMLYPNSAVGNALREGFVLYWSSERPAPRITIDFGDGRSIERTITGNSIHYVLDTEGNPVDGIPGLHGPAAFLRALGRARQVAIDVAKEPAKRRGILLSYHASAIAAIDAQWARESAAAGAPGASIPGLLASPLPAPPANVAAPIAPSKMAVEAPMVQATNGAIDPFSPPMLPAAWEQMLAKRANDAALDAPSLALMRAKMAVTPGPNGALQPLDDASFDRKIKAFRRVLAEDTIRNELSVRRALLSHMLAASGGRAREDLSALNRWVYASLFLTPREDPWLGLLAPDAYSAIEREGLMQR